MKIMIKSNFVLPGLEKTDSLDFDQSEMTLRAFLEKLSRMTTSRLEIIERDTLQVNPEDWEIEINGRIYQVFNKALDHTLHDGDTVDITIMPICGG
jgi:hypothetical protein